ncbi:MAG TPA: hypothetical protein VN929_17080 [Burkholderiales bacterium]|nr:hypothetical protein [Burkholderiales bacterium]
MNRILEFAKRNWWWLPTIVGGLFGAAGTTVLMYYFLVAAIPDLKQSFRDVTAEVRAMRTDLQAAEQRQHTDLTSHITQELTTRERMENSLRVVRSNLIAVRQKVEKRSLTPSEINEILSSVSDVSKSTAILLSEHSTVSGPEVPQMPLPVYDHISRGRVPSDVADTFFAKPDKLKPQGTIATLRMDIFLARSFLAKNGSWHAAGMGIRFDYDGGSAFFKVKKPMSPEELQEQVELFNSVSQVVSLTVGSTESWRAPRPEYSQDKKPREPGLGGPLNPPEDKLRR